MSHTPPRPPRPEARPEPQIEMVQEPAPTQPGSKEPTVHSAIPGVTKTGMFFEMFIFNPSDEIPKSVLLEVLRAARLSFSFEVIQKMSPEAQRQFLRMDRSGAIHPYRPGQPTRTP